MTEQEFPRLARARAAARPDEGQTRPDPAAWVSSLGSGAENDTTSLRCGVMNIAAAMMSIFEAVRAGISVENCSGSTATVKPASLLTALTRSTITP